MGQKWDLRNPPRRPRYEDYVHQDPEQHEEWLRKEAEYREYREELDRLRERFGQREGSSHE